MKNLIPLVIIAAIILVIFLVRSGEEEVRINPLPTEVIPADRVPDYSEFNNVKG